MVKSQYWDKPHARLYAEWRALPSWKEMNSHARALLVELHVSYRPTEENLILLSDRRAALLMNCSRPSAVKALARLEQCGWLEIERVGRTTGARANRSTGYSLTAFPRYIGEAPKRAFLHWRPIAATANKQASNGQKLNQQRPTKEPSEYFESFGDSIRRSLKNIQNSRSALLGSRGRL